MKTSEFLNSKGIHPEKRIAIIEGFCKVSDLVEEYAEAKKKEWQREVIENVKTIWVNELNRHLSESAIVDGYRIVGYVLDSFNQQTKEDERID